MSSYVMMSTTTQLYIYCIVSTLLSSSWCPFFQPLQHSRSSECWCSFVFTPSFSSSPSSCGPSPPFFSSSHHHTYFCAAASAASGKKWSSKKRHGSESRPSGPCESCTFHCRKSQTASQDHLPSQLGQQQRRHLCLGPSCRPTMIPPASLPGGPSYHRCQHHHRQENCRTCTWQPAEGPP